MKSMYIIVCGVLMVCLIAAPGFAEEQEKQEELTLEAMTVTAQKREEKVQDVPISMSLFNELTIQDRMMDNVSDIKKYTPGLEIVDYGAPIKHAPSMRGLYSDYATRTSTAGLFVDGVPITDGVGFDETLLDIERIEVLKGPQGTLYGKNTEVGAINVITKKPGNESRTKVMVTAGEDNKREIAFIASGALVKDTFYVGVSGKHYEKDGVVENTSKDDIEDNLEHNYGKVNLRWTPTSDLDISLITSKIKYNNGGNRSGLTADNDREVSSDLDTYIKSEVLLSALNVSYKMNDKLSLSSVTAYRKLNEIQQNDWDYSDDDAKRFHVEVDSSYKSLSEEFKFNYENQNTKIVSGIFLENEDVHIDKARDVYWLSSIYNIRQDIKSETMGLFFHLTYEVDEKLSVLGGLRYDTLEQEHEDSSQKIDYSENETSPKIGATYQFKDNLMSYATISKGYRAGGFNTLAPDGYSKTYDKESLYSYEIGLKGSALNNRMTFDAALYQMDITDMQVSVYINPSTSIKANAAEATSQGVEASMNYQVTDRLNLFTGVSCNDISFDKYHDGKKDYSGKRAPFSPGYNFNAGLLYRSLNGFFATADISGFGDMYLDSENDYKRDAFNLVDTKVGYETASYDVYLYAKNLFDTKYDIEGHYNGTYSYYSAPREIGVTVAYRL